MARALRIEYEGAVYHVTSRGNERKQIFFTGKDYEKFKDYLSQAQQRYGFYLHCYVLMSNHYHLLIETPEKNLSRVMHFINSSYSIYTNTKRNRSGHLFQGRYKAIVVDANSYLVELSRYMHLNPVRAKIVERPEDYPYSSYNAYVSRSEDSLLRTSCILGMFSSGIEQSKTSYKSFVESALGQELQSPLNMVYGGAILGCEDFIEETLARIEEAKLVKEDVSYRKSLLHCSTLEVILAVVSDYFGITVQELIGKGRKKVQKICVYMLKQHTVASNSEIGELLGNRSYTAAAKTYERFVKELESNDQLKLQIEELDAKLSPVKG